MCTRKMIKKYRYYLLLVFLGLTWISLFDFMTQMSSQGIMHSDSFSYHEAAKSMYIFCSGNIYRPILVSAITGVPYLFGYSDNDLFSFSFYVNIFCWLCTSLLLFEIFKSYLKQHIAFIATFFTFFIVGNTAHVFHLLTETIFQFIIVLVFYLLLKYYKTKEFWYLSLSLALLLSSMLVKPGSKFLAIVIVLYFIKEIIRNYKSKSILFIYGSLFMILIQCAGMKYQFGNFTLSYIDSATYYNYMGSKAMCFKFDKEYSQKDNPRADYLYSNEAITQKKIASEDLKNQMQFNTFNLIKAYFSDLRDNTVSGNSCIEECKNLKSYFWKNVLFDITKWQNRIFTLIGILLSMLFIIKTYNKANVFTFVSFYILYIIVLSGISCGQGDRFHLVTFPFVILLFTKFLSETKLFKPFFEPLQK